MKIINVIPFCAISMLLGCKTSIDSMIYTYEESQEQSILRANEEYNSRIKNLKMTIDDSKGIVESCFDYEPYQGKKLSWLQIKVRLFDKNGKYITESISGNVFIEPNVSPEEWKFDSTHLRNPAILNLKNNCLSFEVTAQEADYIKNGEFGMVNVMRGY